MTEHNKEPITIDVGNAYPLADGTYTTAYMNAETGQYGVLMVFPRDRLSVADSLVAANQRVEELMRRDTKDEVGFDDLTEIDRALHSHRAEILRSADWRNLSPRMVLAVYRLYSVSTEE